MNRPPEIVELSDAELDAVTGGARALAAGGLVNVALSVDNIEVLKNFEINVTDVVDIQDVANNNNVSVGAIIQLLGGGAAILQRQAQ